MIELFELVDIEAIEYTEAEYDMVDIEVEEDHTFILANGIVSHNSAIGNLLKVRNPQKHGGFPLRGMPMNTFSATEKTMLDNKELSNIMAILGLKFVHEFYSIELESGETIVATINDEVLINGQWIPVENLIK